MQFNRELPSRGVRQETRNCRSNLQQRLALLADFLDLVITAAVWIAAVQHLEYPARRSQLKPRWAGATAWTKRNKTSGEFIAVKNANKKAGKEFQGRAARDAPK
jgi:hypothetical protein